MVAMRRRGDEVVAAGRAEHGLYVKRVAVEGLVHLGSFGLFGVGMGGEIDERDTLRVDKLLRGVAAHVLLIVDDLDRELAITTELVVYVIAQVVRFDDLQADSVLL